MYLYCFNTDCKLWGERVNDGLGRLLVTGPHWHMGHCPECGHVTVDHDNWESDRRTDDDLRVELKKGYR